jgi:hypothetical protein
MKLHKLQNYIILVVISVFSLLVFYNILMSERPQSKTLLSLLLVVLVMLLLMTWSAIESDHKPKLKKH